MSSAEFLEGLRAMGRVPSNRLLKKSFSSGCSKMPRCKAPEILRNEAYLEVRRNDLPC